MILAPIQREDGCETGGGKEENSSLPPEQVAIHYIDGQVAKARQSLRRTRTLCIVSTLLILGYMSIVTSTICKQLLRPQTAAELATYYFSKFASQNSRALWGGQEGRPYQSTPVKSGETPDQLFHKSNFRANSESPRVQADVATYVQGFISHHGNVQDLFREAQHPKTVQELTTDLDQEIRERLPSQASDKYPDAAYMSYLNEKLETLTQLELQLNRLAENRDLTPYEKALRRVIASSMGNIRGSS